MEGKSKGYPPSSFVADLFDVKEPSSSEILATIFPSPQKDFLKFILRVSVGGRISSVSDDLLKQTYGNQPQQHPRKGNLGESMEPCHLSSSIYYGGQDGYSQAPSVRPSLIFKKSGGEDDDPNGNNSQSAVSRGNWWQGSLYY